MLLFYLLSVWVSVYTCVCVRVHKYMCRLQYAHLNIYTCSLIWWVSAIMSQDVPRSKFTLSFWVLQYYLLSVHICVSVCCIHVYTYVHAHTSGCTFKYIHLPIDTLRKLHKASFTSHCLQQEMSILIILKKTATHHQRLVFPAWASMPTKNKLRASFCLFLLDLFLSISLDGAGSPNIPIPPTLHH